MLMLTSPLLYVCCRVGNLLGARKPADARLSGYLSVLVGTSFMAVCGLIIFFMRNRLGHLFTADDADVLKAVALIAPLGALYQVHGDEA